MMLKFGRPVVVLAAALTFSAASMPSFAHAQGYGPWGQKASESNPPSIGIELMRLRNAHTGS
jgi:hypothetical protein